MQNTFWEVPASVSIRDGFAKRPVRDLGVISGVTLPFLNQAWSSIQEVLGHLLESLSFQPKSRLDAPLCFLLVHAVPFFTKGSQ